MGTRLVTVATFDTPLQAELAANVIRAADIPVTLADVETVGMHWGAATALGGVKVQVREEDAERAGAALDRSHAAEAGAAATRADPAPDLHDYEEPLDDPPEFTPSPPPTREATAERLVRAAWYGVLIPPVWFYTAYLWQSVAFGTGPLSAAGRRRLLLAVPVLLLGLPMTAGFVYTILRMLGVR